MLNIRKTKGAANIRKPALPGRTSDMANIRKTKKCCKHAKTSFTRANIRNVKHPKNQKLLQTSENQLNQGKHQICQTSEKPKKWCKHPKSSFTRANIRYVNIRKTKKCCKHPKTSFTMANIRYVKHPKNQNVLETSENRLYQGEHPIYQKSVKPKSAANIRKPALPWQKSDMSNIRKNKKCWMLETSGNQIFQGKHPICQTSSNPKVLQTSEN